MVVRERLVIKIIPSGCNIPLHRSEQTFLIHTWPSHLRDNVLKLNLRDRNTIIFCVMLPDSFDLCQFIQINRLILNGLQLECKGSGVAIKRDNFVFKRENGLFFSETTGNILSSSCK